MHGQLAAAAEGKAVDRGDQRFAEGGDPLPGSLARVIEDAGEVALGHFIDVGTGGECLAAAGQHHDPGLAVGLGGVQGGCQFAEQFAGQGIQGGGALQGNQSNAAVEVFDSKGLRHGGCPHGARSAQGRVIIGSAGEPVFAEYIANTIHKCNVKM